MALLRRATLNETVQGIRVARSNSRINHLLFANDSIIFGEASTVRALNILEILRSYAKCSNQLINVGKSSDFFSSNMNVSIRSEVVIILGF